MAAWFASSAEGLRKQIEAGLAASPTTQRMAWQEDALQTISSGLFGSPEQGTGQRTAGLVPALSPREEGLQGLKDSFLSFAAEAVGAKRAGSDDSLLSAEELMDKFTVEAGLLSGLLSARGTEAGGLAVAEVEATMKTWEERLVEESEGDSSSRRLARPALRALLRSGVAKAVLEALASSGQRYRALDRAACCAKALAEADNAEPGSPTADRATVEESAGEHLARLLSLTSVSAAPTSLLAKLLGLLAAAMKAADACRSGSLASDNVAAEEEVRWVLNIINAALTDSREADALAGSRLGEAIDQVLAAASAMSSVGSSQGSSSRAAGSKAATNLQVGDEVWACYPGDGCWYRARVKVASVRQDRVQVSWKSGEGKKRSGTGEFLPAASKERATLSELSATAVLRVEETIRRPPPVGEEEGRVCRGDAWEARLSAVEAHAMHVQELKALGNELERYRSWEQSVQPSSEEADAEGGRDIAACEAAATAAAPVAPPLSGAADFLQALRTEAEERAEALGHVLLECEEEAKRFEEQIESSSRAMGLELGALAEERGAATKHVEGLKSRREELLEELRRVEGELTEAEVQREGLDERGRHLESSMARVADELSQELHGAQEHGRVASERQGVLQASVEASLAVERRLTERSAVVADAATMLARLNGRSRLVTETYATSDRARCVELQELVSSWHETVWGPPSSLVARDPEYASALRGGHLQAIDHVTEALQEALGAVSAGSALPSFEGLFAGFQGVAAAVDDERGVKLKQVACYKEMEQQLKDNIDRLTQLEFAAEFGAFRTN